MPYMSSQEVMVPEGSLQELERLTPISDTATLERMNATTGAIEIAIAATTTISAEITATGGHIETTGIAMHTAEDFRLRSIPVPSPESMSVRSAGASSARFENVKIT